METLMRFLRSPNVAADYDRRADVLYITKGKPVPGEGEPRPNGIVLRYASNSDTPIGVTVIGFNRYHWRENLSALATIAGNHIRLSPSVIEPEIVKAIREEH